MEFLDYKHDAFYGESFYQAIHSKYVQGIKWEKVHWQLLLQHHMYMLKKKAFKRTNNEEW